MSLMQRNKGKAGERDVAVRIAELTGWPARRIVRQREGDPDIEGVPGWRVEVKNQADNGLGDLNRWWAQAERQANGYLPLLIYKRQRGVWRAVWPAAINMVAQHADYWRGYQWTVEGSLETWAAVAREIVDEVPGVSSLNPLPGDSHSPGLCEASA